MHNANIEAEIRYRLFGRKANRIEISPGLQVLLSVRESWGGNCKRFAVQTPTISKLEAQIMAEREARRQGKIPQCLLGIGTGIFDPDVKPYVVKV